MFLTLGSSGVTPGVEDAAAAMVKAATLTMMYGHGPDHEGWVELGPLSSIDPGSGTTPTDILAAVREDVGGRTLRRITGAMTADSLTTTNQSDGSTVYSGKVAIGQIAGQTGFKGGQGDPRLPLRLRRPRRCRRPGVAARYHGHHRLRRDVTPRAAHRHDAAVALDYLARPEETGRAEIAVPHDAWRASGREPTV